MKSDDYEIVNVTELYDDSLRKECISFSKDYHEGKHSFVPIQKKYPIFFKQFNNIRKEGTLTCDCKM